MGVSQQRAQELAQLYNQLKEKIEEIEHKYSLNVYEIDLDFDESLGLEKLTFTPKTDEEIAEMVQLEVEQKCASQLASAEKSYANARAALIQQQLAADESHRQKTVKLAADYAAKCKTALYKAVNAGLNYSSIFQSALQSLLDDYNAALSEQTAHYEAQNAAFDQKAESNLQTYQQQIDLLNEQKEVLAQTIEQSLRDKQADEALSVQKYNNSVDEKETKYHFNCQRAMEAAVQAERNRALTAARIYAQLGETGLEQRKKIEKYQACLRQFAQFTKEEANVVLTIDACLQRELGEYYTTLVDWINDSLP